MSPKQIPNVITMFRIVLVVPTVMMILNHRFDWALGLFFVAGVSDAVDGFLAKHFGWITRFGSLLDPVADKLLMIGCYGACAWVGLIPWWLAGLVIGRDVVIVAGATAYYLLLHPFEGQPTWISKFNTLTQIVLLLTIFWHYGFQRLSPSWINGLIYLAAVTTIVSGIQYIIVWGRHFLREISKQGV
ncbi:MAG TPA: CDP-alcohol phosphatidyltransferase family protein [Methylothermaceae bacterium]|nr:CDP-alcohol phosphatidyltransferase family protein [Methylothermaceae bacterium]